MSEDLHALGSVPTWLGRGRPKHLYSLGQRTRVSLSAICAKRHKRAKRRKCLRFEFPSRSERIGVGWGGVVWVVCGGKTGMSALTKWARRPVVGGVGGWWGEDAIANAIIASVIQRERSELLWCDGVGINENECDTK
jgi:hypothetical protein